MFVCDGGGGYCYGGGHGWGGDGCGKGGERKRGKKKRKKGRRWLVDGGRREGPIPVMVMALEAMVGW